MAYWTTTTNKSGQSVRRTWDTDGNLLHEDVLTQPGADVIGEDYGTWKKSNYYRDILPNIPEDYRRYPPPLTSEELASPGTGQRMQAGHAANYNPYSRQYYDPNTETTYRIADDGTVDFNTPLDMGRDSSPAPASAPVDNIAATLASTGDTGGARLMSGGGASLMSASAGDTGGGARILTSISADPVPGDDSSEAPTKYMPQDQMSGPLWGWFSNLPRSQQKALFDAQNDPNFDWESAGMQKFDMGSTFDWGSQNDPNAKQIFAMLREDISGGATPDPELEGEPKLGLPSGASGVPWDTGGGTGLGGNWEPFEELGWGDTYRGFINTQMGIDSPGLYQHVIEQGLSKNPLLRTAQGQFLVQADYEITSPDTFMGDADGTGIALSDQEGNAYWDFLKDYSPLKGGNLIYNIDRVIGAMNSPAGVYANVTSESSKDAIRGVLWKQRYALDDNAELNQQQLAALPILEHTSPVLKNEMASVLSTLYSNWQVQPNRRPDQSWLEYVREKKFFGLVPDQVFEDAYTPTVSKDATRL